jgi:DNA polymerase-3 subunit epsilon
VDNQYLLFIDTETSGLPLNWNLPYGDNDNWPHALQISWLIYDAQRQLVKQQDHYIKSEGIAITPAAGEIHGLTHDFLAINGKPHNQVMLLLANDLLQYQPMVIGHFMRLDYYVLSAGFYRSGIDNPLNKLPVFCTMVATTQLVHRPLMRHLRLEELYYMLFKTELQNQHNALDDVQATVRCFFELRNRGEISEKIILQQNKDFEKQRYPEKVSNGCLLPAIMIILVLVILMYSL